MTNASSAKRATKPRTAADANKPARKPHVAVLGGGISGLTTAMQLIKAGFDVTVIEAAAILGGNTSSETVRGIDHDVYPHMFCDWYANFWNLFENDLGLDRHANFEARPSVMMLEKGKTEYRELFNPTSIEACLKNIKSGVMTPAELVLLGYTSLDLLAFPFERSGVNQLQQLDVNGFIYSRGYATEPVAKMENYVLSLIWSINSEQTAAATFQNFLRHTWQFPTHAPFAYMLRGSIKSRLIAPLEAKLRELGCKIELNTTVNAVQLQDDMPLVNSVTTTTGEARSELYDYVVCALTSEALAPLAVAANSDSKLRSLADCEPSLANLQRLTTVNIPVVDLYLDFKLPDLPKQSIGLAGSQYGLTMLDISQLWIDSDFGGKTALVIAASDAASIPSDKLEEIGWLTVKELAEFFPAINPGSHWGDPAANIDWNKSNVRRNTHHTLFLNDVGSWAWRPASSYPITLPRVAFAGDLCLNEVDMATVEGAVISGISASRTIQNADMRLNKGVRRGRAIQAKNHTVYSAASFRAAKLWMLPAAYAALGMAAFEQWRDHQSDEGALKQGNHYPLLDYLALVPMQYTIDWWKGAYWLWRSLWDQQSQKSVGEPADTGIQLLASRRPDAAGIWPDEQSEEPGQPDDNQIGLGAAMLMVLGECVDFVIDELGKDSAARGTSKAPGPMGILGGLAQTVLGGFGTQPHGKHRRRWRMKL